MARPLNVVFLVDALGWEIVEHFDFCRDLLPRRSSLGTVLGYSSAAIPSLLSGASPDEHGSWAMFRLAGKQKPFGITRWFGRLPHALDWRVRRLARRMADRRGMVEGYYDLYEIPTYVLGYFDVAQRQDPYVPGGLAVPTLFDAFVDAGVRYRLWYYRTSESENMNALVDAVGGEDEVLFLYTAELDAMMHRVGIFADEVGRRLAGYERFLERVFEAGARQGREVRLCILSDHGMTNVDASIDLWGHLERRGHRLRNDYMAFYDSTMARFWCDEAVLRDAVAHAEETGAARLLADDELKEYGCWFPGGEYGRHVLLANPGVMIVPSFMGGTQLAAMHGYDPEDRFSKGCFLTNGEGTVPDSILGFKDHLVSRVMEARS